MKAQHDRPDVPPSLEEEALRAYPRPFWEKKRWWVIGSVAIIAAAVLALR